MKGVFKGLLLTKKKKLDWEKDNRDSILNKTIYNQAILDIEEFIRDYENNAIDRDLLKRLEQLNQGK